MKTLIRTAIGTALLLLIAACSGNSAAPSAQVQASTNASDSGTRLIVRTVPQLGNILVDASGMTVYTPEQEASGRILCTGSCTGIWVPVTVPTGTHPSAGMGVTAHLGTTKRADGSMQVTVGGEPLYTFAEDSSPGAVNGNDVTDSFNAIDFTWHALSPAGGIAVQKSTPTPSPSGSSSSGGSTGGYNY